MEKTESTIVVKSVQKIAFNDERILIIAPGLEVTMRVMDPNSHGKISAGRDLLEQLREIASDDDQENNVLPAFFAGILSEYSELMSASSDRTTPLEMKKLQDQIDFLTDEKAHITEQYNTLNVSNEDLMRERARMVSALSNEKKDLEKQVSQLSETVAALEAANKTLTEKNTELSSSKKTK